MKPLQTRRQANAANTKKAKEAATSSTRIKPIKINREKWVCILRRARQLARS